MSASLAAVPIRQDAFLPQFNESSGPSANIPRLPDNALMALPYIGALVGVDQQVPSKAIYAIYDPEGPGLRYVYGDGAFVHADNVCFMNRFTGGSQCRPDLAPRQRTHFIELLKRSAIYYQTLLCPSAMEYAKIKVEFPNPTAVKEELLYLQDLNLGKDACPALKLIPPFSPSDPCIQDQSVPCITLSSTPVWDFRPSISFQARVSRSQEAELLKKHKEFVQKYQCQISFFDFQQSTFCLVGLANENLISFLKEKKQDGAQDPYFQPELIRPLRTTAGWTPDCFLARFGKFEKFVENLGLSCPPSPVNWLEAELDDEKRLERAGRIRRLIKPWKGTIYGKAVPGVLGWEFLQTLVWQNGSEDAGVRRYPRPFEPVQWRPLTTEEIIRSRPNLEADARKKLEAELKEKIKKERAENRNRNRNRKALRNGKRRILSQPVWDEEDEGDISSDSLENPGSESFLEILNSHEQNGEPSFQEHNTIETELTYSDEDMYDASDREISRKRKHTRSISSSDEERRPLKRKGEYLRTDTDQNGDIHTNIDSHEMQQSPVTSSVSGMDILSKIFGSDTQQKSTAKNLRIPEPPIITGMDMLSNIFGSRIITKNTVTAITKQERISEKSNEEPSMKPRFDKRRKTHGYLPQQASSVTGDHYMTNQEEDTEIEATNTSKELPWISYERKLRETKTTRAKRRRPNEHNKTENLSFDNELRDNNDFQPVTLGKNEDGVEMEDQAMVGNLSITGAESDEYEEDGKMALDTPETILQNLRTEEDKFGDRLPTEGHGEQTEHEEDMNMPLDAPENTQPNLSVGENQTKGRSPIENKDEQDEHEGDRDMSLDAHERTSLDLSSEPPQGEPVGELFTQDNEKQSSQEEARIISRNTPELYTKPEQGEDNDTSRNGMITETEQTFSSEQSRGNITPNTREAPKKERRSSQELESTITQPPIIEEIIQEELDVVIKQEVELEAGLEEYNPEDRDFDIESISGESSEYDDDYMDIEGDENAEDAHISWNGMSYFCVQSSSSKDNYDEELYSQEPHSKQGIAQRPSTREETGQAIQNGVDSMEEGLVFDSTILQNQSYSSPMLSTYSDIEHLDSTKPHPPKREQPSENQEHPLSPYQNLPGLPNDKSIHKNHTQPISSTSQTPPPPPAPSPSSSTSTSTSTSTSSSSPSSNKYQHNEDIQNSPRTANEADREEN